MERGEGEAGVGLRHSRTEADSPSMKKDWAEFCSAQSLFVYTYRFESELSPICIYEKEPLRDSFFFCNRDLGGIQTHNLLIRSQMLYSVELRGRICSCLFSFSYIFFLFNTSFLTSKFS